MSLICWHDLTKLLANLSPFIYKTWHMRESNAIHASSNSRVCVLEYIIPYIRNHITLYELTKHKHLMREEESSIGISLKRLSHINGGNLTTQQWYRVGTTLMECTTLTHLFNNIDRVSDKHLALLTTTTIIYQHKPKYLHQQSTQHLNR